MQRAFTAAECYLAAFATAVPFQTNTDPLEAPVYTFESLTSIEHSKLQFLPKDPFFPFNLAPNYQFLKCFGPTEANDLSSIQANPRITYLPPFYSDIKVPFSISKT